MDDAVARTGYFSILRWALDPTRDEAKNVAVVLVDPEGAFGGIKAAPVSSVSPRLQEQGIVDRVLLGLKAQFETEHKPHLGMLTELHASMKHSLYLTEPKPTMVADGELVLNALYRAYVAPKGGGSGLLTKGRALDRVVDRLRRMGHEVHRGNYLSDFLFDAVLPGPTAIAIEVLSFATNAQRWAPVEHDAGHFLFALERVGVPGMGVFFPPADISHQNALHSHERIQRWFGEADVPVALPDTIEGVLAGF